MKVCNSYCSCNKRTRIVGWQNPCKARKERKTRKTSKNKNIMPKFFACAGTNEKWKEWIKSQLFIQMYVI